MDKKYQIFISSTYEDLKDQRDQAVKSILRMGHLPVGMEMFNAADDTQWEIIKGHIDNSDYYVVILAHRYGSEDANGVSYTEKEYDYALDKGVPCLGFVIDGGISWPPALMAQGEQATKLQVFKEKIKSRMVNFWTNSDNLSLLITASLSQVFNTKPRIGWVRANEVTTSPLVAEELSRLSKRNEELTVQLARSVSQPDEFSQIIEFLKKDIIDLPDYPDNDELSLFDLFITVYTASSTPYDSSILSHFPEMQATKINRDIIISGLEELSRLGLIDRNTNSGTWRSYLTEKGKSVYAKHRFSQ